jgi:hypothetical protein
MKNVVTVAVAAVLLGISTSLAIGFPVRDWTPQELFDEADIVVTATASKPTKTENTDNFESDFLQQYESELDVESVLKGKEIASDTRKKKTVKVVHFRYRADAKTTLGNGPLFAVMGTTTYSVEHGKPIKPKYLLYLRKRKDGRYEPVSGNHNPVNSIIRLLEFPEHDPALDADKGKK